MPSRRTSAAWRRPRQHEPAPSAPFRSTAHRRPRDVGAPRTNPAVRHGGRARRQAHALAARREGGELGCQAAREAGPGQRYARLVHLRPRMLLARTRGLPPSHLAEEEPDILGKEVRRKPATRRSCPEGGTFAWVSGARSLGVRHTRAARANCAPPWAVLGRRQGQGTRILRSGIPGPVVACSS